MGLKTGKEQKELLSSILSGMKDLSSQNQKTFRPYEDLLNSIYNPSSLDEKTKELISIGIAVDNKIEATIVYHISRALKLGATEQEIMEAAMMSVVSGGIGSMFYCVTYVKEALKVLKG